MNIEHPWITGDIIRESNNLYNIRYVTCTNCFSINRIKKYEIVKIENDFLTEVVVKEIKCPKCGNKIICCMT